MSTPRVQELDARLSSTLNVAVSCVLYDGGPFDHVSGRKIRQRIADAPTSELVQRGLLDVQGTPPAEEYRPTLAGLLASADRHSILRVGNIVLAYVKTLFAENPDFKSCSWHSLLKFSQLADAPLADGDFGLVKHAIRGFQLLNAGGGAFSQEGIVKTFQWLSPRNIEDVVRLDRVEDLVSAEGFESAVESVPARTNRASRPIVDAIHRTDWTKFVVPEVGDQVGRFSLIKLLGSGGYGVVWEAIDTSSDQVVAVKIFNPEPFQPQHRNDAAERFHSGAAAMRKLGGTPQIVEVVDGPDLQGAYLWFAMRLYPARDLRTWSACNPRDWRVFVGIIDDVLEALKVAHQHGIVHRDVRPGNILIEERDGRVRGLLTDFDIAYYDDQLRTRDTTHLPIGVLRYLPPDLNGAGENLPQLMRRPSNDLFSLAVVVLDLFTNSEPPIPPEPKEASKRMIGKANEPGMPRLLTRRLASFLALSLSGREADRVSTVAAFRRGWTNAIRKRDGWDWAIWIGLFLMSLAFAITADWAWHASDSFWTRVASSAAGMMGVASLASFGAAIRGLFQSSKSWVLPAVHRAICDSVGWRAVLGTLVVLAGLVAFWSQPTERIRMAWSNGGGRCAATTESGRLLRWFDDQLQIVDIADIDTIQCPVGSKISLRRRSFLTPLPEVLERDPVRAISVGFQIAGPNSVRVDAVSGDSRSFRLLATEPFPENQPALAVSGVPHGEATLQWRSDYPAGRAELWLGDQNVGLSLVERGVLNVYRDAEVPASYAEAAKRAQERGNGVWGAIRERGEEKRRAAELARCPENCCQSGALCEELKSCEARWTCMQCRGDADPGWRLRLDALSVFNEAQWEDVKVCLHTKACGQQCVPAANKGQLLGEFDCSYSHTDLQGLPVRVLGTNVLGHEVRVAQTTLGVKLSPKSICQGISASKLEPRNGHVNRIVLSMRPAK